MAEVRSSSSGGGGGNGGGGGGRKEKTDSGRAYHANATTQEWIENLDPGSGKMYYINTVTNSDKRDDVGDARRL